MTTWSQALRDERHTARRQHPGIIRYTFGMGNYGLRALGNCTHALVIFALLAVPADNQSLAEPRPTDILIVPADGRYLARTARYAINPRVNHE